MSEPIIDVRGVSKEYTLTHKLPYVTLRDTVTSLMAQPFQLFRRRERVEREKFLAVNNVSFSVQRGEAIGLIGPNGSGKSTLLKILSQITAPTRGEISLHGRVASLLEVGTGFHPELTGRENIYLNGAVLGMSRREITRKFDDIVAFSGVEKFLDTPVKRYSSGMHVRLAFSVAAHLEPEILLIDEVLSVGDAEFQKKCLGKMDEVTRTAGRTIIFVSHNMEAVKRLCTKCILLKDGQIQMIGNTGEVVKEYLHSLYSSSSESLDERTDRGGEGKVRFTGFSLTNAHDERHIHSGDKLRLKLQYRSRSDTPLIDPRVVVSIVNEDMHAVLHFDSYVTKDTLVGPLPSRGEVICETDPLQLMEGRYFIQLDFLDQGIVEDTVPMAGQFNVETKLEDFNFKLRADTGIFFTKFSFRFSAQ